MSVKTGCMRNLKALVMVDTSVSNSDLLFDEDQFKCLPNLGPAQEACVQQRLPQDVLLMPKPKLAIYAPCSAFVSLKRLFGTP